MIAVGIAEGCPARQAQQPQSDVSATRRRHSYRSSGSVLPAKRTPQKLIVSRGRLDGTIVRVRGRNVMLDFDLASLYAVTTKVLIQAMKRNRSRFPADFMFQLTTSEFTNLRSQ